MSDIQSYGASSESPRTPAGWYELQGELRYWDGAGWTEHRAALSWAIGLVNFLVGWTLIGWLVALVMACMAHQVAVVRR